MTVTSALPRRGRLTAVVAVLAASAVLAVTWLLLTVVGSEGGTGIPSPSSVTDTNGDPPHYQDDGPGRGRPWKDAER